MLCNSCTRLFHGDDNSRRWVLCQAVYVCNDCAKKEVVCEKCQERFLDCGEELEQDMILCGFCRKKQDFVANDPSAKP